MSEITVNHILTLKLHGSVEVVYCTTMGHKMKIKAVHFKCTSPHNEKLAKKAVAAYNRLNLSITVDSEQIWFNVVKLDRNIPLYEFKHELV